MFAAQLRNQCLHAETRKRIECSKRFVQQKKPRVTYQCSCQGHALGFTTGQGRGPSTFTPGERHFCQRGRGRFAVLPGGALSEDDVVLDSLRRNQTRLLEDDGPGFRCTDLTGIEILESCQGSAERSSCRYHWLREVPRTPPVSRRVRNRPELSDRRRSSRRRQHGHPNPYVGRSCALPPLLVGHQDSLDTPNEEVDRQPPDCVDDDDDHEDVGLEVLLRRSHEKSQTLWCIT